MCRRIECKKCGRPTFAGCGAHVEQVLGDVPRVERCRCREDKPRDQRPQGSGGRLSWLRAIIRR
jgi:hypothetical protein